MPGPSKTKPKSLAGYFEALTRSVFSSGMNWRVVEAKLPGMREAFHDFDPKKVAAMTPADVERLANDTSIIRNRRKIEGTIDNAHMMLDIEREFGSFERYLVSLDGYEATVADLKQRFRFMGNSSAYTFLWAVGERVPEHEDWMSSHPEYRRGWHHKGVA